MKLTLATLMLSALLALGCAGPSEPPPSSIKPIDSAKVTAAMTYVKSDPELAGCVIQLKAENDLLVMNGKVANETAKKRAEELVRKVDGIKKVANHLTVEPQTNPTPQ